MIPNAFPTSPRTPRIAFIGEAPAGEEEKQGIPFCGASGWLLWHSLEKINLTREQVFVGNVSQHRFPGDSAKRIRWNHPCIQEGIAQLQEDLRRFAPDFVVLLGGTALRAAFGGEAKSIDAWKGTLFLSSTLTGRPVKHMAMFHPAAVLHNDSTRFWWWNAINRIEEEMGTPILTLPQRGIHIHTDLKKARRALRSLHGKRLAWDIEGYARSGVTCFGLAPSPWEAHVFPIRGSKGPIYSGEHEEQLWKEFGALLNSYSLREPFHGPTLAYVSNPNRANRLSGRPCTTSASRPGLLTWNGLYDAFVLAYSRGINPVGQIVDDGMVLMWELFSEVDKSLGDAASFLTREPYYKDERGADSDEVQWRYNGKDCCVTFECIDALYAREECTPAALDHYAFNMSLLPPILYMELRGMRFDEQGRKRLLEKTLRRAAIYQNVLSGMVGMPYPENGEAFKDLVLSTMCVKNPRRRKVVKKILKSGPRKGQEVDKVVSTPAEISTMREACEFALAPCLEKLHTLRQLCGGEWDRITTLPPVEKGQARVALGVHFNINSPAANEYLYNTLQLPPIYKHEDGKRTDKLTHDVDALLTSYMRAKKIHKYAHAIKPLRVWLLLAHDLTACKTLVKPCDQDMRMRCSYNHVGPDTGRFSCSASSLGIGYNLQTVTDSHRSLFLADEGCEMGQWDLKGADGWTIACHAAAFGDVSMLDDFAAKIKPAQAVVLLMLRGGVVNTTSREVVKKWCADLPDDWRYKAAKRVIWGTCYLMGLVTMGNQITQDAWKEDRELLVVEAAACRKIQTATKERYPGVVKWQERVKQLILDKAQLTSASGHTRRFYGRRWEQAVDPVTGQKTLQINRPLWGTALSNEPQENTTFATKLALWRLWYDPENRVGEGRLGFPKLRVEPLHTVHDSLLDQWQQADHDFAVAKHREWFNNPMKIAGRTITIPVAGEIGVDWGMKGAEKV